MKIVTLAVSGCFLLANASMLFAAEKQKPYPHYWMSISTTSQNMPGMSSEMAGMAGMFGGKNMFGPKREMKLQLVSPHSPSGLANADHFIPEGMKMGESLPLITPKVEKRTHGREDYAPPEQYEKPKTRMLIYWGCGDSIRKGQPKVLDTATMSMTDFGKAFAGRTPSRQTAPAPRKGWTYAEWPDLLEKSPEIPADSSLIGAQKIAGNYLPKPIQFHIDSKRDFMAPVEFLPISKTETGAIKTEWKPIPTAISYFATAMGHDQDTGESIFWSASEVQEIGFGLNDYLTPGDVNRFLKEKVLLPTSTTTCTIPPIFKGEQPGMMQFIAYGEEQNYVQPPKPKDPKKPWDIDWSAKVRLKSTSMLPLMETDDSSSKKAKKQRKNRHSEVREDEDAPQREKEESSPMKGMGDALKGMFGF